MWACFADNVIPLDRRSITVQKSLPNPRFVAVGALRAIPILIRTVRATGGVHVCVCPIEAPSRGERDSTRRLGSRQHVSGRLCPDEVIRLSAPSGMAEYLRAILQRADSGEWLVLGTGTGFVVFSERGLIS